MPRGDDHEIIRVPARRRLPKTEPPGSLASPLRTSFDSLDSFYVDERRRRSGERDYGVLWRMGEADWPRYRVSWVIQTGEIYVIPTAGRDRPVYVLGVVHELDELERRLAGWPDRCGENDGIEWVKSRLSS